MVSGYELITVSRNTQIMHKSDAMIWGEDEVCVSSADHIFNVVIYPEFFVVVTIEDDLVFGNSAVMNLKSKIISRRIIFSL